MAKTYPMCKYYDSLDEKGYLDRDFNSIKQDLIDLSNKYNPRSSITAFRNGSHGDDRKHRWNLWHLLRVTLNYFKLEQVKLLDLFKCRREEKTELKEKLFIISEKIKNDSELSVIVFNRIK